MRGKSEPSQRPNRVLTAKDVVQGRHQFRRKVLAWTRRYGPTGAFSFSFVVHIIAGLLVANRVLIHRSPPTDDVVIQVSVAKEEPEPPKEEKRDIVVSEEKPEEPAEVPVKTPAEEPAPQPEEPRPFPKEDPLLLAKLNQLGSKGKEETLGLQPSPSPGDSVKAEVDIFKGRSGEGKAVAILRGGGSDASENAVVFGLEWLKRHQCRSGAWSTWRFTEQCPPKELCKGAGTDARNFEPAMTGLGLLCFLGAGHTHKAGDHVNTVSRGLRFLKLIQQKDGLFGQNHSHLMYNHSIATLAMAEAYAMTHDEELKDSVRQAISFIVLAQQPGGGWDYTQARTGRNDTSITGWVVMALKSASSAGVAVPWQALFGPIQHLDRMTEKDGKVNYASTGFGEGRKGVGMVAVGMLCRQFLGWPRSDPLFDRMAELMLKEPPTWQALSTESFNTMYYWYYGTLALFQHGGDPWRRWNGFIRDMLCRKQRRDRHANGSWDPDDRWFGPVGGRVYSTTMAILCLEVYYRYLPIYEEGGAIDAGEVILTAYQKSPPKDRLHALRLLAQMGSDLLPSAYRAALNDEDAFVRMHVAAELFRLGDHSGVPVLAGMLQDKNGFIRSKAIDMLSQVDDITVVPALAKALSDEQAFVAEKAALLLVRLTRQDYGFRVSAPAREKAAITAKYREWWKSHEEQRRKSVSGGTETKLISGKVLAVRGDAQIVMLDIGSKQGIRKGQEFYVFRNAEFIGAVKISQIIDGELSSGEIIKDFTAKPIEQNDEVRNVLE